MTPGTGTSSPMLRQRRQAASSRTYKDDRNDILIFSKTKAEHLVHVRMVPETLHHHQLRVPAKASKCQSAEFSRSSVGFSAT